MYLQNLRIYSSQLNYYFIYHLLVIKKSCLLINHLENLLPLHTNWKQDLDDIIDFPWLWIELCGLVVGIDDIHRCRRILWIFILSNLCLVRFQVLGLRLFQSGKEGWRFSKRKCGKIKSWMLKVLLHFLIYFRILYLWRKYLKKALLCFLFFLLCNGFFIL